MTPPSKGIYPWLIFSGFNGCASKTRGGGVGIASAISGETVNVTVPLQMVLSMEGVECRPK